MSAASYPSVESHLAARDAEVYHFVRDEGELRQPTAVGHLQRYQWHQFFRPDCALASFSRKTLGYNITF